MNADDWDDEDDLSDTIECPRCGAAIYHEAEWCPRCDHYLSEEESHDRRPNWVVITAVVLIGAMLLPYVVSLLARR